MKSMNVISLGLVSLVLASCASGPFAGKVQQAANAPYVEYNYVIRDRSHEQAPLWASDFESFNAQMQNNSDKYFMSETNDSNNRMAGCNIAKVRANTLIAQQISTYVFSEVKDTTEGQRAIDKNSSDNPQLTNEYKEKLKQQSASLLSGVEQVGTVWEERDFSKAGGAPSVFTCKVLVKIPKKTLDDSIKKVTKFAVDKLPMPEQDKKSVIAQTADVSEKGMSNISPTEM